jgi:hypothetical protein
MLRILGKTIQVNASFVNYGASEKICNIQWSLQILEKLAFFRGFWLKANC